MEHAPNTLRVARRVRRRSVVASVVRRGGIGLAIGCGLGLVAVVIGKVGWLPGAARWEVPLAAGVGVGLAGGLLAGLVGRWSLAGACRRADLALGLRDRLGNALAFARGTPGPAERLAIRDAERAAAGVAASRVVPLRLGSAWAVWPTMLAAGVATGVWAPQRVVAVREVAQQRAREPVRRAAAEAIAAVARAAREAAGESPAERAGGRELARMEEIERELLDGTREPEEALADGARAIASLADRVEREAETGAMSAQLARRQLADQVGAAEGASELAEALAEGDLQRARRAADDLMDRFERMSADERAGYAEELERLSAQMRPATDRQDAADRSPDATLDAALREQGVGEPESWRGDDPAELRERLEEQGVERETAERLAEELAEREQRQQAAERAREEMNELSDAARDAAGRLREPTQPQEPGMRQPNQQGEGDREAPPTNRGQDREADGGPPRPGEAPVDQRPAGQAQPGRGEQAQPEQGGDRPGQTQDGREGGARQRPAQTGQPGENPAQRPSDAADEPQGADAVRPGTEPGGTPEGAEPTSDGGPERPTGEGLGDTPWGEGDGPDRATDGSGESPDRRAFERLRRQIERMAERDESAEEQRGRAERLREQAERLLEQASPEQRRELERLAGGAMREGGSEQPGPGGARSERRGARAGPSRAWDSEAFDARGVPGEAEGVDGRVIAEWYGDDEAPPTAGGANRRQWPALQQAARGAERALERRAVPREREDLVRRVFERLRQRAAEAQGKQEAGDGDGL